jgi:hypothetical protein
MRQRLNNPAIGENNMETIKSIDDTTIAFDECGQGPAVILVDGALAHRIE